MKTTYHFLRFASLRENSNARNESAGKHDGNFDNPQVLLYFLMECGMLLYCFCDCFVVLFNYCRSLV